MPTLKLLAALIALLNLPFVRPAIAQARAPASGDAPVLSAVASLLYDMRRIVEVRRSSEWKFDRYEYQAMMPDALVIVCRTTHETRRFAVAEARNEVARLGGPLEDALKENHGELDELKALLFATQVAHLVGEAIRRAPAECPPWARPQRDFEARQSGFDRYILSVEGGGAGMLQGAPFHPDGTTGLRGARRGGGRLPLGRGFGHRWNLRVGPELDASMLVRREGNTTDLPLQIQAALPVVVRNTDVSWHYELELAPVVMLTEKNLMPRYGSRLGVLIGISPLETGKVIPWAGLDATAELFPGVDGRPMQMSFKGGWRAGIDWDF